MPEFHLDTTGKVILEGPGDMGLAAMDWKPSGQTWADLDAFTQGYIEALMADADALDLADRPSARSRFDRPYGFSDLAPETLAQIIADCARFKNHVVHIQPLMGDGGFPDEAQAGRDFWYTRNGHGCGFWDGDWPEPYATELTVASDLFGTRDVYLGDDGKVWLS